MGEKALMKLNEIFDSSVLDVETKSPSEIAKYHNVNLDIILQQLRKGIKVEYEHTSDFDTAKEIALDHLKEFPDYYDRLEKAEEVTEELSFPEIKKIEHAVDQDYNDFDIDVDLGSNHFVRRVNDPRNSPEIQQDELENTLTDVLYQNQDDFDQLSDGDEAVLSDIRTDLNIPVIFHGKGVKGENTGREELDMVAKTAMRKPDFRTSDNRMVARATKRA